MERTEISKLDEDILEEILVRVPLESLVECICVCKKWNSIIRNKGFKDRYWDRSMTRPRLLFQYSHGSSQPPKRLFRSVYQQEKPLLSSGLKQMPISSSPPEYEMISQPHGGLVCLQSENKFVLCNPGTNKFKALPECESREALGKSDISCYFGYDDVTKLFKLLTSESYVTGGLTKMLHQVMTVNMAENAEEETWRSIECEHNHSRFSDSVCIKGVLYYVAWSLVESDKDMVISFNLGSEKFTVIDLPDGIIVSTIGERLVNYNGKVCLVNNLGKDLEDGSREFMFYVKDENADKLRVERLVIRGWRDTVGDDMRFYFQGTIGTAGELVFATSELHDGSHFVLYYNKATENLRKFKIEGVDGSSYYYVDTFLNHYDSLFLT